MAESENVKEIQTTEITTSKESDETETVEDSGHDLSESVIIHAEEEKFEEIEEPTPKKLKWQDADETQSHASSEKSTEICTENLFKNHPHRDVLINFKPSDEQMSLVTIVQPKTLQQIPLQDITTRQDLEKLVQDLLQEKEIGVDVEYSDHGYKALTCLVQISTPTNDYIIDAILLKEDMIILNSVFTDPCIVKVFHSSSNDLKWLQEDFQLFVVNMFDTQHAMKILGYPKLGLDVLLDEYRVHKDKNMQREDFRKRPLPPKFKDYARTDSHYLITFYHKLKNELIEAKQLQQVFDDCKEKCGVVYERIEDNAYVSVETEIKDMHTRQLRVLEELNKWRHRRAEYIDQNPGHILSKNNLKQLVLQMPVDKNHILNIAKSKFVKEDLDEIVRILQEGRPQFETKQNLQFVGNKRKFNPHVNKKQNPQFGGNKRKFEHTDFGGSQRRNSGDNNDHQLFDLRYTLHKPGRSIRRRSRY